MCPVAASGSILLIRVRCSGFFLNALRDWFAGACIVLRGWRPDADFSIHIKYDSSVELFLKLLQKKIKN